MRLHIAGLATIFTALCLCPPARADAAGYSGISIFRADVTVNENGTLEVREEFTVTNAASFYQRGFRRDLPISSVDRWDLRYVGENPSNNSVRAHILEVTEDGRPVPYQEWSGYGYAQLSIGERNVPLDSGEHRFTIHYTVDAALYPDPAHDILYWNAIGHERNAPVAEAILAVHLPAAVPGQDVEAEPRVAGRGVSFPRRPETTLDRIEDASGAIVYRATNVGPRQSLSLVLTWPSGYVRRSKLQVFRRGGWALAGPAVLFLFYLIAWWRIGPEPAPGPLVARYEPPEGLSAAAVRYVASGTTDGRSFAAVIAQLAVRGCIRVEPIDGKYKLSRLMCGRDAVAALAPDERCVLGLLFEDAPVIEFSPSMEERNAAQNSRYISHIHEELARQFAGKYFTRHVGVIALGVFATFALALPLAALSGGREALGATFFTMWILFCGLILGLLLELSLVPAWKNALQSGVGGWRLLPGTAAMSLFIAVIVFLMTRLAAEISTTFVAMIAAFLLINLLWAPLLKRRSPMGRQVADEIAGFRQFLEKVEHDPLNRLDPGEQLPRKLDRYLPFAIALEVKEAWGDHLAQTFFATTVMVED